MYFDKEMVKKGTFKTIVQVKGRLGQRIPILIEDAIRWNWYQGKYGLREK